MESAAAVAEKGSAEMAEAQSLIIAEMRRCVVINLIRGDRGRGGAGSQKRRRGEGDVISQHPSAPGVAGVLGARLNTSTKQCATVRLIHHLCSVTI